MTIDLQYYAFEMPVIGKYHLTTISGRLKECIEKHLYDQHIWSTPATNYSLLVGTYILPKDSVTKLVSYTFV